MIYSVAQASVSEATHVNVLGKCSDLVVDTRPDGLRDCYLLKTGDTIKIVATRETLDHHDRASHDDGAHPAYLVFGAAGIDCTHTVYDVVSSIRHH